MDSHHDEQHDGPPGEGLADELLRRALLDPEAAAAVALKIRGLALSDELTVIFHGRRDLGTIQTYVANGGHGEGEKLGARDLLRVPVDLDLGEAYSREEAQEAYAAQARTLRDALQAADTVLAIWEGPLRDVAESGVTLVRSVDLDVPLPAHRLMPIALVAPERQLTVVPVCGARTLSEGRPPMGIACAQQDVAHVYPLPDDPEAALEDFVARAADHARTWPAGSRLRSAASSASWRSTGPTSSLRPADGKPIRVRAQCSPAVPAVVCSSSPLRPRSSSASCRRAF